MDELTYKSYYVFNIIYITTFNYDKYYQELLKNALKYGMSFNDFWYNTKCEDYYLYEKSYYERLDESSHIEGYYNYIALKSIVSSIFAKNKEDIMNYPTNNLLKQAEIDKISKKVTNEKITKENLDEVFRNRLKNCY